MVWVDDGIFVKGELTNFFKKILKIFLKLILRTKNDLINLKKINFIFWGVHPLPYHIRLIFHKINIPPNFIKKVKNHPAYIKSSPRQKKNCHRHTRPHEFFSIKIYLILGIHTSNFMNGNANDFVCLINDIRI